MKKIKKVKNFKKWECLVVTGIVATVVSCALLYLFHGLFGVLKAPLGFLEAAAADFLGVSYGDIIWSLFAAQLSISFLSISILSILSDKSCTIYWRDLVEERLLKPRFGCFAAFTYYSFAATFVSFFATFCGCIILFFVSFACNIVVLCLLADSVLDVYFNKEKHRKKMQKELRSAYKHAFVGPYEKRNEQPYREIMDNFAVQIQRHREDTVYIREAFELVFQNVELFDTSVVSAQEVMAQLFDANRGNTLALHSFDAVVKRAEQWAQAVEAGDKSVAYTADWLFWTIAVEKWSEEKAFANAHSHSIHIWDALAFERILNRRLEALIRCERFLAEADKSFVLPEDSSAQSQWVRDKYFYLVQALFGAYAVLYADRLEQFYTGKATGVGTTDKNVDEKFPENPWLLGQLVALIEKYGDINTHLGDYSQQVKDRFLHLAKPFRIPKSAK